MLSTDATIRLTWPGKVAPAAVSGSLRLDHRGDEHQHVVLGDNLAGMAGLREAYAGRFTLAYLDPPFFTRREHAHVRRQRDPESGRIERTLTPAFDDRWDSLEAYLEALAPRVAAARELLCDDGCLVLHVDPKTSHYAKVLCDEIFGARCFASEIIWRYRRWPAKTRNFQRVHDVLLRYVKDPHQKPRFQQLYEPLAPSTLATWGTKKQRAVVDASGRRRCSSRTDDKTPGAPLGDVWEIGIVAPVARERTGYPTQKPEALLERIVLSLTEPGDWVLDPYLGSGTTLAVCARHGRKSVGIDSGSAAVETAVRRLGDLGKDVTRHHVASSVRACAATSTRRSRRVA